MTENKRLKILMFGWELPPHYSGGLGVACNGLARQMVGCGVDLTFVLPKRIPVSTDYMRVVFANNQKVINKKVTESVVEALSASYIRPEKYKSLHEEIFCSSKSSSFKGTLFEEVLEYGRLAEKLAKEEDFDVIHAHDWLSVPSGVRAKKKSGKPLVFHVHATEFDRCGSLEGGNERVHEIEKAGLDEADKVVAISHRMKDILVNNYKIDDKKIDVVHNGVDETHFSGYGKFSDKLKGLKHGGDKVVLYFGRLTIQKGIDYFLEAAGKVLKTEKNVKFLIVGSGDMQEQLMMQAAEMGIANKVIFTGWLKDAELFEACMVADLFVSPSISEPFGLTSLELMMLGKPVIVTKQSGVSEAISHALKVDFWDTDEMANMIVAVTRYGTLSCQLAEYGQEEVKSVNWREAALKCVSIYNKLCYQT